MSPCFVCIICASLFQIHVHKSKRHTRCTSYDSQTVPSHCCVSLINNTHISQAQSVYELRRRRLSKFGPECGDCSLFTLREGGRLNSELVLGSIMWLIVFFSSPSFCSAVTINSGGKTSKRGEFSLSATGHSTVIIRQL